MLLHRLLPSVNGIPVLMYHKVWPGLQDGLTVTPEQLRDHLFFLRDKGYRALHLQDFLDTAAGRRQRQASDLLLTFDDGYRNNLSHAYPLMREMDWSATVFVISGTLNGDYPLAGEAPHDEKMNAEEYRMMDPQIIQLGLHGHRHENFSELPVTEAGAVIRRSLETFRKAGLPFYPVLAYPYGARPKTTAEKAALKRVLQEMGIQAAFRIGNKPEKVPSADLFEIKRIDLWGADGLRELAIKIRKGKLKPF